MTDRWTSDLLFEHFTALREADLRANVAALASADKAITKVEETTNARLGLLNEFKQLAAEKDASFYTRTEATLEFGNIRAEIANVSGLVGSLGTELAARRAEQQGSAKLVDNFQKAVLFLVAVGSFLYAVLN